MITNDIFLEILNTRDFIIESYNFENSITEPTWFNAQIRIRYCKHKESIKKEIKKKDTIKRFNLLEI